MNSALPRIAHVGNLANVAYLTAKALRRAGVQADFFILSTEMADPATYPGNADPDFAADPPDWLKVIQVPSRAETGLWSGRLRGRLRFAVEWRVRQLQWWRELRTYALIQSYTASPIWVRRVGRPYVAFATGSDLRELAATPSRHGRRALDLFRHANVLLHGPDPGHVALVRRFRIAAAYLARQIIDTDFYSPGETSPTRRADEPLVVFHPTNLDWVAQEGRWQKGNDRLFRAFARFVSRGHAGRLVYVERGADIEATRALVGELDIGEFVEPIPGGLNATALRARYRAAHVVADQFDNGGFGRVGLEAMSCLRPVLVDVDPGSACRFYDSLPPVMRCRTEDEIYGQLVRAFAEPAATEELGLRAREWVVSNHSTERVAADLIWHYERILGRPVAARDG